MSKLGNEIDWDYRRVNAATSKCVSRLIWWSFDSYSPLLLISFVSVEGMSHS